MRQLYSVPEKKRIRVLVDTDAACEVDDPFAIAHALMSPKLDVKGILSEHFAQPDSEAASYREIENILALMGLTGQVPLYHGAEKPHARSARDCAGHQRAGHRRHAQGRCGCRRNR